MYDNDKYNNKKDDDTHGPFSGMLASLSATCRTKKWTARRTRMLQNLRMKPHTAAMLVQPSASVCVSASGQIYAAYHKYLYGTMRERKKPAATYLEHCSGKMNKCWNDIVTSTLLYYRDDKRKDEENRGDVDDNDSKPHFSWS